MEKEELEHSVEWKNWGIKLRFFDGDLDDTTDFFCLDVACYAQGDNFKDYDVSFKEVNGRVHLTIGDGYRSIEKPIEKWFALDSFYTSVMELKK